MTEPPRSEVCAHIGCHAPPHSHGVCKRHYNRARRRAWVRWADRTCTVTGCPRAPTTCGLCPRHYARTRRAARLDTPQTPEPQPTVTLDAVRQQAAAIRDRNPRAARRLVDRALGQDPG